MSKNVNHNVVAYTTVVYINVPTRYDVPKHEGWRREC